MRITEVIEPGPVVEAIRAHDKLVALPTPHRPAEHSRIGFFGQFAAVGPDDPMHVMTIKDLQNSAGNLNEFKIARIVLENEQPWNTQRIAISHWIIAECRWNSAWAVAGLVGIK